MKLGGPLKEKCITVILGPFESKVFSHYNCCWGPLWKQSSPLIHCSYCWAPFESVAVKTGYQTIPINRRFGHSHGVQPFSFPTHVVRIKKSRRARFGLNVTRLIQVGLYVHVRVILQRVNTPTLPTVKLQKQGRLLCTSQLQRGARGKCHACIPLNTPLYITLTMILYENMKPFEHVLLHPICALSHPMCACKHCKVSFILLNTLKLLMSLPLQKHRYHAIFHDNLDTQVD